MTSFIEQYKINKKLCDKILEYRKTQPCRPGSYGNGILNKNAKDSIDCVFNQNDQIYREYNLEFYKCLTKYIKKYKILDKCSFSLMESTNIQFYPPGGGYKIFHSELNRNQYPFSKRVLVFMTYLNDVYIGGQTEFLYLNKSFRPRKGKTLIWPVDWTHTHRGKVAPFEEKSIVTGWIHESDETNS
tara:strand:- start:53 stop:610 length:558 start_codon:yes stop_codon:yes gene_type:complete